jgi:hypothetical protein
VLPEPFQRREDFWQGGFRSIGGVLQKDGERVVWVTHEEYKLVFREGRMPAGDT